ncbi:MAG: tetratricopeptide repeat protein, partial [Candidatus Heimdallarchaeota archaeon]
SLMEKAEELKIEKKYNKAVESYLEAINFVEAKIKEEENRKDEIENIKSQIDQIYSVEIIDILEKAYSYVSNNNFNDAFIAFDEAIRIADKIEDVDLKESELNEIIAKIDYYRLEESIYQGEKLISEEKFDNAIAYLKNTLEKAAQVYKSQPNHEIITRIKDKINQTYSQQVDILVEEGNQSNVLGNSDLAIKVYEDALKITKSFFESELKNSQVTKIRNLINQIYSNEIKPLVEKGKHFIEQKYFEDAVKEFEKSLELAYKMYESEQKKNVISQINEVAADVLNPVYEERLKPILSKGKELIIKENYAEDIVIVNDALGFFEKALDIARRMADSKEKTLKVTEIEDLINKTCKKRINLLNDNSLRKIAQRDFDGAASELYGAISIAKRMTIPEEHNKELERLKADVNKTYTSQIEEILREGRGLLEQKDYDNALNIFNKALDITNKMYLNEQMEQEVNKIKSLIYQAELKHLVGRGDLIEEQKKFERELEKLNKKMEYAKTIDDSERKFEEMNKIKKAIDKVHHSEIKLFIEQAEQLSEKHQFNDAFEYFEKAISINDLIEDSEYKDKIPIKTKYKNELINKSKLGVKNKNYESAIEDCKKALGLDSTFIEAYFYMGIINTERQNYDTAIQHFKKALDLNKNHSKSWNYLGLVYEKKMELDNAIASYSKAVEIEPFYTEAFYNIANSYRLKQDYSKAIDNYKKAIEIESDYAFAWLFVGYTYMDRKEYSTAIDHISKAIDLNPEFVSDLSPLIKEFKETINKIENKLSNKFENR